jgi:hypothetical protein
MSARFLKAEPGAVGLLKYHIAICNDRIESANIKIFNLKQQLAEHESERQAALSEIENYEAALEKLS